MESVKLSTDFVDYVSRNEKIKGFSELPQKTKEEIFSDFQHQYNGKVSGEIYRQEAISFVSFISKHQVWHDLYNQVWCEYREAIHQYEKWPGRYPISLVSSILQCTPDDVLELSKKKHLEVVPEITPLSFTQASVKKLTGLDIKLLLGYES